MCFKKKSWVPIEIAPNKPKKKKKISPMQNSNKIVFSTLGRIATINDFSLFHNGTNKILEIP
jgi:hypothetical protein